MSSPTLMSLLCVAEFALWIALGFLFWKKKLHGRFPAMGWYLALRVASAPVLLVLILGQARHWFADFCSSLYFDLYWAVYIASALLLFFICIEVFRTALSSFSGLQRLGTLAFRWVAAASVILSLSTLAIAQPRICVIADVAYRLMRTVSILELCLLAFLCLCMNALRLTVRDMAFGIALGFGMMSTNDFINASLLSRHASLTDAFQFVTELVILLTLSIWIAYTVMPEPERKPLMMPANSAILRWNEIASALGHTGTQVAVQPAGGFVLTEVELGVEMALNRNLRNRESET